MRVVVVGECAVTVPEGCSDWQAAMWIIPGILPGEYLALDVVEISRSEVEKCAD